MIEWADKVQGEVNPRPEIEKFTYHNANEVKRVVNEHEWVLYNVTLDYLFANGEPSAMLNFSLPYRFEITGAEFIYGTAGAVTILVNGVPYTGTVISIGSLVSVTVTLPTDCVLNLKIKPV